MFVRAFSYINTLVFLRFTCLRHVDLAAFMCADATPQEAVAGMTPSWRAVAEKLKAARELLSESAVPMLHRKKVEILVSDAEKLKLTKLLQDREGKRVQLGSFTLPALDSTITAGPKGMPANVCYLAWAFNACCLT